MKIEQIIYFVKIARSGSISLTAEQVHISSPAISVAVSDLENELGVKLFHRTRQGMRLTEQGRNLLAEAEKILEAWENLKIKAQLERSALRGELSLSVLPSLGFYFIPMLLQKFKESFPLVDIKLYSGGTGRVIKDVESGKSQLGLITSPKDLASDKNKYVIEPLFSSNIVAIANDTFMAKLTSDHVSFQALIDFPLLFFTSEYSSSALLHEKARQLGKTDGITIVESYDTLQQLCLSGMGIGIVPELVAWHSVFVQQEKLRVIQLVDLDIVRHYACFYLKSSPLSKSAKVLLDYIHKLAEAYRRNGDLPPRIEDSP